MSVTAPTAATATMPTNDTATEVFKGLAAGRSLRELSDGLAMRGAADAETAREWVREFAKIFADARSKAARKRMLSGALWFGGGAAITGYTYFSASVGGQYFVTWGAIIFGAFDFVRGFVMWVKARSVAESAARF